MTDVFSSPRKAIIQWLIVDLISVPSSSHSAVMIKCGGRGGGSGVRLKVRLEGLGNRYLTALNNIE